MNAIKVFRIVNTNFERYWAIIIVAFSSLVPQEYIYSIPSICLYKNITGHNCLGCGMTKAFISFFHFHLKDFYTFNKLSVIVIPLILILAMKQIFTLFLKLQFTKVKSTEL